MNEDSNLLTVNVDDLRNYLGEACRLINEIRFDLDLKYKIPKTEDYLDITSKLSLALQELTTYADMIHEKDAIKDLAELKIIYIDKNNVREI